MRSFGHGCMNVSEAWSQLCQVSQIEYPLSDSSVKALKCEYARSSLQIQSKSSEWLSGSCRLSVQLSRPCDASGLSAVQNMGRHLSYFNAPHRRVFQTHKLYQRLKICA